MKTRVTWTLVSLSALAAAMLALTPARVDLLSAQSHSSDPHQAVKALESLHGNAPAQPEAARQLATAYAAAGRPAEGVRVIGVVGKLAPLAPADRKLARKLALEAGQPALALAVLGGPHENLDSADRADLVTLALQANRPALALVQQRILVADAPTDRGAITRLRDLALASARLSEAIAAQRQLCTLEATPEHTDRLVTLLTQSGDAGAALTALEQYAPPHDTATHLHAMQLAEWAARRPAAIAHGLAAFNLAPEPGLGRRVVAHMREAGDARVGELLQSLVTQWPADRTIRTLYKDWLVAGGHTEALVSLLQSDVAAAPDDHQAHLSLVDFLLGHGRHAEAARELTRRVGRMPGDREALHRLAQVQVWQNQMPAAWQTYAQLLSPPGPHPRAWRTEWLAISRPVDDLTTSGRANLRALLGSDPSQAVWRRRLAKAEMEQGETKLALYEQTKLVALPGATRADRLTRVEWLLWDQQLDPALSELRALKPQGALPDDVLRLAIEQAAQKGRWQDTRMLLGALSEARPKDAQVLELLAVAHEADQDLLGAATTWQSRLALGGADPSRRLTAAGLYVRLNRPADALGALTANKGRASDGELALRAALAEKLGRPADQATALEALLARRPDDSDTLLTLADLREKQGQPVVASALLKRALDQRPDDDELLVAVAAKQVYSEQPAQAAALIARVSALKAPSIEALQLLADYESTRGTPARAAAALDALHAKGAGDAGSYFRRGELALGLTQSEAARHFEKAVALGQASPEADQREAGVFALQRLGRELEAEKAWRAIALDHPARPAAYAALSRAHLARGELAEAEPPLAALERLAPGTTETRIVRADWLRASERDTEAAELLAGVPQNDPDAPYAQAAEALARHAAGQHGRARAVALGALTRHPSAPDVVEAYRLVRNDGSDKVGLKVSFERYAGLDRGRLMAVGLRRLGDGLKLEAEAGRLSWAGGQTAAQEFSLSASTPLDRRWRLGAKAALSGAPDPTSGGLALQTPTASLALDYAHGNLDARIEAAEARWEDTDAVAIGLGREHRVGGEVGWSPHPKVFLRGAATVGAIGVRDGPVGLSTAGTAELSFKPDPVGPWTATYQLVHRSWGAAAASQGLPDSLEMQRAMVSFNSRLGPVQFELQPGAFHDIRGGTVSPSAAASAILSLNPDAELSLNANWGGRALATGSDGDYSALDVSAHYWF